MISRAISRKPLSEPLSRSLSVQMTMTDNGMVVNQRLPGETHCHVADNNLITPRCHVALPP